METIAPAHKHLFCSCTCQVSTSAVAYSRGDTLFEKQKGSKLVCRLIPHQTRRTSIYRIVSRLDRFGEDQHFEEAQDGRQIKAPPACSGGYAARTHEHVTDE